VYTKNKTQTPKMHPETESLRKRTERRTPYVAKSKMRSR